MSGLLGRALALLGLTDPGEASQADLEALENAPIVRRRKKKKLKAKRSVTRARDELGRFAKPKKKATK